MKSGLDIVALIRQIVADAKALKESHTDTQIAPVNYACVFCQNEDEFSELFGQIEHLGKVAKETSTGPVFKINPIETVAGPVSIIKIRKPDDTRPERGDADFTVSEYKTFRSTHINTPGFKLIKRPDGEMIELTDSSSKVRAYFSEHPLDQQL